MEPLSANDPRMIGEFRLHARLGAGGMGQVYLGFSPAGHAVAIKVIHPQFASDQEFLRRFSREVAAASAVGGMYTAPVVDYDLTSATPWLATAYVPGPTLATVVNKHGALSEAALWRLAAGLAEALRAVHAKGLIHRDLKPANVLLADSGPHVIDFGISRASSSATQLTSAGMAIGTPGYMSPEQAQVLPVGPSSDMFSLGCVLAFAAAGRAPFNGDNPASILFKIVSTEPDLSAIPPGFRQVIQACLKKDPAERPAPAQLIATIGELGPATPVTLGSFWPGDVARIIAAEQAAQTPPGLTPPAPFAPANTPGTGRVPAASGGTGPESPAPVPAAASGPSPASGPGPASASGIGPASGNGSVSGFGPAAGIGPAAAAAAAPQRPATALAASVGPAANAAGHAPMISDGYYAAAQRPSAPSLPPMPQSYAAPSYAGQQPGGQASPGPVPPGPVPPAQAPFGQASFGPNPYGQAPSGPNPYGQAPSGPGAPYAGPTPPPYAGPPPAYPGQAYLPRPYPGQPAAGSAGRYVMGRRKPMAAEVPPMLRNAVRLMYAGFLVTVVDVVLSLTVLGRYDHDEGVDKALGETSAASSVNSMTGAMAIGLFTDFLGLACWALLAVATRRGHGWTRIAGTVLLAIYSVVTLAVVLGTSGDPGAKFTTVVVWALGVASVIPLRTQQAREFFFAWRRR